MKTILLAPLLINAITGLNILLNNDDGFGSSNIREFYRLLIAASHNVYIVAPALDQSGQGGHIPFATSPTLTSPSQYDLIGAGAPSLGQDPNDSHIWYYNGTPSSCTMVGLDYVLPTFANFSNPDLFVAGPNFGNNVGTFAFTGSGTLGATYTAILRNIPGVAFSAANPTTSYLQIANSTRDPATLVAAQAVKFINLLAENATGGKPLLPLGYGINVNIPTLNCTCQDPPLVQSRFTGGSGMPLTVFNETSGVIQIAGNVLGYVSDGANQCINGDCDMPGESNVIKSCATGVTIFTVDYDAPINDKTAQIEDILVDNECDA